MREWAYAQKSDGELYREQEALRRTLSNSFRELWCAAKEAGNLAESSKWEKIFLRIDQCQMQWIGYKAACCGSRTRPVAVPIGCNHRLCPLCASRRSTRARVKIKSMYDRLTHPALITLTIPNIPLVDEDGETISKHTYKLFRYKVRKFLKQRGAWIKGGVYSMETTFNRAEKTFHIHAHVLADLAASLPCKTEKVDLAGQRVYKFTALKMRLEFDWLRLWGKGWGKAVRSDASQNKREGDTYTFESWVMATRANKIKEFRGGCWRVIEGLTAADVVARTAWNRENRRVIDLRPVVDRDGAAREVLKYITKVADFCDMPEVVGVFCDAVKAARLIQTFGTWYGANFDADFDPENLEKDSGGMKCACGLNCWERMGVLYRSDVVWDVSAGQWRPNCSFDHNDRGTVPRPTIRALEVCPEDEDWGGMKLTRGPIDWERFERTLL